MADYRSDRDLVAKFRGVQARFTERDKRHGEVSAARRGDVDKLMPGMFPKKFPRQITANIVNVAAQDIGELLGELPDISCRPMNPTSDKSKKAAAKRTKINLNYVSQSRLQPQMYSGADRYVTFAAMPFVVEPDFDLMQPTLRVDNPVGAYYDVDFFGRTKCYFKRWYESVDELVAKFPDLADKIRYGDRRPGDPVMLNDDGNGTQMLEVIKYFGPDKTCVLIPERGGLVAAESPNPMGRVPVFVAELPKWDDEARGQFDQSLWIQLARARMALFTLEATDKSINAPIKVPKDVTKFNYGPNALIHTDSTAPNAVERVRLDIPRELFAENATLQQEERIGSRYPEGRSGNIDASVITGQGVKELLGTMDSQVKTYQDLIGLTLSDALGFAMEMDEKLFGDVEKTIEGEADGAPFVEKYTPSKDINGNYKVTTSYGLSYGMDHQRGLIFALQLRGDRVVDRGSVRRQFAKAFGADAEEIARLVDIEEIDDALKQSVFNLASTIGPEMVAQGMDPLKVVRQMATLQKRLAKGDTLADAFEKAMEPTEEEKQAQQQEQQAMAQDPMAMAAAEMGGGTGDQMPASPAGARSGGLQQLLAGLTGGGTPQLGARVRQNLPT